MLLSFCYWVPNVSISDYFCNLENWKQQQISTLQFLLNYIFGKNICNITYVVFSGEIPITVPSGIWLIHHVSKSNIADVSSISPWRHL